jgi:hypothetical protein
MKNWHDESVTISNDCPWLDDSNDAMLIAEKLQIPFQTIDLSKEYQLRIIDYMFNEYKSGRTPNPDVLCNREIKFDIFLNIAINLGADYIATGHYARVSNIRVDNQNIYKLLSGIDSEKDQSYFLCQLNQNQLSKVIFPIGELTKTEVRQIAKKNNLIIVEDAAQAFGARLNNKKAGSFSKAAAFSMNPMKPLAGYGEGGLAVTDDKNIYEKLKILRHAATTSDPKKIITNYCVDVSLNHKMDSLNAALLLVALKYFPKKIEKRNEIAKKYMNGLNNKIKFQKSHFGEKHGRFVFPIIVDKRDELKKYLEKKNIETKIFNVPLVPETPVYSKYNLNDTPNAKKLLNSSLVIPSHEKMKIDEVDYVIDKINNFMHINL